MISNDRELRATQEWIDYWKSTRSGHSWIGNEQASHKIIQLRRQMDAYRRRQGSTDPRDAGEQSSPAPA